MLETRDTARVRKLAALVSLLAHPMAAGATEAEQCIMSTTTVSEEGEMGHFRVDAPQDLGDGFITYHLQRSVTGEQSTTALFEHCATGRSIQATIWRGGWDAAYDAPADPADFVREAIASPETFSLDEVVVLLRSQGIEAETRSSEVEDCGCAVFYPELVGDRRPWRR